MADKNFGVRKVELTGSSGTPNITSPTNLNLNANTVAISTDVTVGGEITSNVIVSAGQSVGIGSTQPTSALDVKGTFSAENYNISGIVTAQSLDAAISRWNVTADGSEHYNFAGPGLDGTEDDPTIYLVRGQEYIFNLDGLNGQHPFEIRISDGGSAYNDGITNNSGTSGNLIWDVQQDAPRDLVYQCTAHPSMVGDIVILNSASTDVIGGIASVTNLSVSGISTFSGQIDGNNGADISGGETTLSSATVSDLTDNRVVIAGTSGALEDSANLTFDGSTLSVTGDVSATNGTFSGDVSIGGTLTYEDVTNIDSVGVVTARLGVKVPDSQKVFLGTGDDLQIYHDGSINRIRSDVLTVIEKNDSEDMASFMPDGAVVLFHNGSQKFETTSAGIKVSGSFPDITIHDTDTTNDNFRILHNGGGTQLLVDPNNVGPNASHFIVGIDGTERLRITSAGLVGIGTANPSTKLHLSGGSATQLTISNTSDSMSDGDTMGTVDFTAGSSNTINARVGGLVEGTGEAGGDLVFETRTDGGSLGERLRIKSDGNVGVGDDDPDVPFNVKAGGASFAGQTTHAKIEDTTSLAADVGGLLALEGVYNSGGDPAAFAMIHGGKENADNGNYAGYLRFLTRPSGALPQERLRIDSSGRMGLGTQSPGSYSGAATQLSIAATGNSGLNIVSGTSNTGIIRFADGTSGDAAYRGRVEYMHDVDALMFGTAGAEQMRIDSSGRLLLGLTSARATKASASIPSFQIEGTGDSDSRMNIGRNSNADNGPEIHLYKTRGTSLGSNTVVQDDDFLGSIGFYGADGSDLFSRGAEITAAVDGTPGSDDMPTRITFGTCPSGAASPTERLRIDSDGDIKYGTQGSSVANNSTALTHIDAGREYWSGTAGDYRALKHRLYYSSTDDAYGMGISSNLLEIQSQTNIAFFAGTAGAASGRRLERMRILSGGGLTFNGDTAAANALDDFEEGAWTPDLRFGGGTTGITYLSRNGKYVKIGRLVWVTCRIALSNKGSSTGSAQVFGLPFDTSTESNTHLTPGSIWMTGMSIQGSPQQTTIRTDGNGQGFIELKNLTTSGEDVFDHSDMTNSGQFAMQLTYLSA